MSDNKKNINELTDLPRYKNEYTAQLEEMGITTIAELKEALAGDDAKKIEEVVGSKSIALWKEELGVDASGGGDGDSRIRDGGRRGRRLPRQAQARAG